MKIVLAEKVSPATLAVFQTEAGWQIVTHDQIKNGLAAELADADALVVRSAVQVDEALLEAAPKLRVIGRAGVGVDNIDADASTRRGIVVMNTPGANAIAVAELTIGLMLALARQLPRANTLLHAGKWEKKSLQGAELRGKQLGILGLGRVGLEVARRAKAFGMELLGHDPFVAPAVARENGVRLCSVDELFRTADFLTLHVGLTPQTAGIINAATLATMRKNVRIVNCARGELIDDAALVAALKSGQVAGAALDVFSQEPLKDSPYFGLDNMILTPHIAGSTGEAQEAVGVQIAQQVKEYLKFGVVQNAVNLPSMTYEEYQEVSPYILMAERLGAFLSPLAAGNLESIHISYSGRLAQGKTELVRNAAIQGVFANSENVNRINALSVAAERGIRVHEDKKEEGSGGAGTVLKITLHTGTGDTTASATVLHGSSPRLLACDGIDIEAPLHGTLLFIRNLDVPGVIGRIGTILGEHKMNIANFALGRSVRTGRHNALAVVQIDGRVAPSVLVALQSTEAITEVRLIELADRQPATAVTE
ncbi:MAG: D-3-phosphoglycerate dehydrogenase / 2-oxoglutarate reductase [Acidobacteriaceae bacterium]|jgi:D-3-phosphoglycerate dehydrogenase|nr:D-3-phosphoglycerate dehydrogenase / 2-oxoglutarate reductase [Acidobacteriaceae bacterium]MDT7816530.1 D-3-phosphoglycerate dehydrogenase / 2-oxoglutarate reductase [Acidobacteriaceae bacterium]MDX6457162.1 D-3-phosphoglycerate dehydrogenase / 2-oxoglutarate reductase [Acidobacteriaceae bacterium]MEA2260137.1 D-3-phosphoglycerate dehydrogenase / 2-oxoglutarate reductase [Acidobacteriaceae bacterium]MEA2542101.1 D-3-phosphoglycerate dehydrogenase / 2-oxoglutarate reductase [Acidobacteriaceae